MTNLANFFEVQILKFATGPQTFTLNKIKEGPGPSKGLSAPVLDQKVCWTSVF